MDKTNLENFNRMIIANRPGWKFILEDPKVRILTNQWIIDFMFLADLLEKHNMILHDIMTHPTYGICLNVTMEEKVD